MARTLLLLPPLLLLLASVCFDNSMAINCFSRNGNSMETHSNGTTLSCGGPNTYCYSYSVKGEHFAGCSNIYVCSHFIRSHDCQTCSTDYCNSMTPSRISCFYRDSSSSSDSDNGTMITCHSRVSTCYSAMGTGYMGSNDGCGDCPPGSPWDLPIHSRTCVTCNTDYCNSVTPSSIRCYENHYDNSKPVTSNGKVKECPTGFTSCYSYSQFPHLVGSTVSGCGACNATDDPTCVTCSTDLCNTITPSAISCNSAFLNNIRHTMYEYAQAASCPSEITTCFSSVIQTLDFTAPAHDTTSVAHVYGCGNCSADTMPSCVTCTGDYCNDVSANTFSCYHHSRGNNYLTKCTKGVNSCYTLTNPIVRSPGKDLIPMAGCGVCTPTTAALYGCTSCSTSNCNGQAASTSNPSTPSNPSGNATSGISCYHNFGQTQQASQKKINCPTSSSCFDSTFRYGLNRFYFSGCGSCPFGSGTDGSTCRTCSSDYCNSAQRLTGITCYHSFGATAASERKEVECSSSSSCFDYSYKFGVSELFFAGCGNCSFDSASTNCRSCFTDLCNSGPGLGTCGFSAAAAAAAAAFVMKFVSLL